MTLYFISLYIAMTYPILAPLPLSLAGNALAFHAFTRSFGQAWGVSLGSTILSNQLAKKLQQAGLDSVLGGDNIYQSIPLISTLCVTKGLILFSRLSRQGKLVR
jgi:hypothetical protein